MGADEQASVGAKREAAAEHILVAAVQAAGTITLNRKDAHNQLTRPMRAAIAQAIAGWTRDPEIYAVLMQSAIDGEFCAGRDVAELEHAARKEPAQARASLAAEYALTWALECFTKPTISLIDGSAMGSGVAISLYGTHRVAGERYRFAMPATAIGLVPDNGVGWAFARMPAEIGMYLALTGRSVGRADAYRLGLATHCIAGSRFGEIRSQIAAAEPVDQVLDRWHEDPGAGELEELGPAIARCFGAGGLEAILERLRAERACKAWADAVVGDLNKRSPIALKITHRHVRQTANLDVRSTLINDFRLAWRCLEGHDFYEGVRGSQNIADLAPRWRPARLADVSEAMVDGYFAGLGGEELQLATRSEMQAFKR
jgi:enoyl-CoA hydratase